MYLEARQIHGNNNNNGNLKSARIRQIQKPLTGRLSSLDNFLNQLAQHSRHINDACNTLKFGIK